MNLIIHYPAFGIDPLIDQEFDFVVERMVEKMFTGNKSIIHINIWLWVKG
jgi:hypothetical protein